MADRVSAPRNALDYPRIDDALFVLWYGNEYKWPDGRRQTFYLTGSRRHVMKDYALFTDHAGNAKTFETESAARAWLAEEEAKRPYPYGVTISTVGEMKKQRGYA